MPVVLVATTFGYQRLGKVVWLVVNNATVVEVVKLIYIYSKELHLICFLVFFPAKFNFQ